MSRRQDVKKRVTLPDPVYSSQLLGRFINTVMTSGKKSIAEKIVYQALEKINRVMGSKHDPLTVFERAIDNVRPMVEVRSRRVGGSTYQIPTEVAPSRATALAMRWIIDFARKRGEKSMDQRLAGELMDASEEEGEGSGGRGKAGGKGGAIKKRDETHRMADANKAFAHYRWW